MQRLLCTPMIHGSFDFFSNIIVLDKYDAKYQSKILAAISADETSVDSSMIEMRALLKHEITHFLDLTTTQWGVEYITRKMRFVEALMQGADYKQQMRVFMLNSTEVEIHAALLSTSSTVPISDCDVMKHGIIHSQRYGPIVMIYYLRNNVIHHQVPLSMLSVLEANATANEFLSRLEDVKSSFDEDQRLIHTKLIEQDFELLLADTALLEYSVLLRIVKTHFEELTLRELLAFVSALSRFTLDIDGLQMAMLANDIERSFTNRYLADSLCMDIRRGTSRPVIFFKSVLLMYGLLNSVNSIEKDDWIGRIKTNPSNAIFSFWQYMTDSQHVSPQKSFGYQESVQRLKDYMCLKDADIVRESMETNRPLLHENAPGFIQFKDLKLLDILLADDTEITMPNRIDIPVLKYFDDHLETFSKLDTAYYNEDADKFHIPPGTPKILIG